MKSASRKDHACLKKWCRISRKKMKHLFINSILKSIFLSWMVCIALGIILVGKKEKHLFIISFLNSIFSSWMVSIVLCGLCLDWLDKLHFERERERETLQFTVFLIHMSIIWIYVMSCICQTGQPAVIVARSFNTGQQAQTFQPNFFMPAMLIDTIDFYRFRPFSLTLTLAWGHKISTVQNLLASFSCTPFNWWGWNFIWCWGWAEHLDSIVEWNVMKQGK